MTASKPTTGVGQRPKGEPSKDVSGQDETASQDYWKPLAAGFVGSFLLMIGSVGLGWLAQSSALRRNVFFIWMRVEPVNIVICVACIAIGGMVLVRAWLRLGQRFKKWPPSSGKVVRKAILFWSLPLMFSIPLFSRDVYAYIGQGRLMQANLDPYVNGISALSNWYQLGADQLWAEAPTPYGPVFLWIEQFVVTVSGGNPEISVFLFRVCSAIGVLLCTIYVPRLAVLHGVNPNRALWLSVANPLLLVNFLAAVHNDALMIGLAIAGLYYSATKRNVLGIVLVTLSIAIKPITIILLPFIGLLWAGKKANWPRKFLYWAMTAAISLGILALFGWINGFWFGWINGLSAPGSVWIWYAPVGAIGWAIAGLVSSFGWDGWAVTREFWLATKVVAIGIVVWLMFRGSYDRILRRTALALGAVVLLSSMIQSWYVVWLIPLFAITGIRNDWQVKTLYFVLSFFMIYAISDQLNVYPYLQQGESWINLDSARFAAAIIALGFAIYVVFFDRKTRELFLSNNSQHEII
ncbi:polyprenol phosphomannose-dependent alpha 1,6 mannosyltransferase MptB [Psychromicrobium sp. YIM B11713]|uniref:polyprenol phosphomannose-dependent alpha 1,6 mannosyltransferase MptB n=1 Tax=Psychromicrobium sp. YIM B11713 TaxID=3145233 RepID=UPI00374FA2EF